MTAGQVRLARLLAIWISLAAVGGCSGADPGPGALIPNLTGAVGNALGRAALPGAVGGAVGGTLGTSMGRAAGQMMQQGMPEVPREAGSSPLDQAELWALEYARTHTRSTFQQVSAGAPVAVTVVATWMEEGRPCRRLIREDTGGSVRKTACRLRTGWSPR